MAIKIALLCTVAVLAPTLVFGVTCSYGRVITIPKKGDGQPATATVGLGLLGAQAPYFVQLTNVGQPGTAAEGGAFFDKDCGTGSGALTAASFNVSNDQITLSASAWDELDAGDIVTYSNGGGTDIGGLTNGTEYYVEMRNSPKIRLHAKSAGGLEIARYCDLKNDCDVGTPSAYGKLDWIDITAGGAGDAHTLNHEKDSCIVTTGKFHTNMRLYLTAVAQQVAGMALEPEQPPSSPVANTAYGSWTVEERRCARSDKAATYPTPAEQTAMCDHRMGTLINASAQGIWVTANTVAGCGQLQVDSNDIAGFTTCTESKTVKAVIFGNGSGARAFLDPTGAGRDVVSPWGARTFPPTCVCTNCSPPPMKHEHDDDSGGGALIIVIVVFALLTLMVVATVVNKKKKAQAVAVAPDPAVSAAVMTGEDTSKPAAGEDTSMPADGASSAPQLLPSNTNKRGDVAAAMTAP